MAVIRLMFCSVWSIFWITLSMILYLFTFRNTLPVAMARHCWSPGILWACGIRVSSSEWRRISPRDPYVFVCNHQSLLDIPILFQAIRQNIYFVAKKELKWVPFLGWYMMATGMIFIDRSNRQKSAASLRRAGRLIHQGRSVIMFPEGTRSRRDQISTFKKGPFILACQAKVAVVPVGIRANGKPFSWSRLGKTEVTVNFHDPVPCEKESLKDTLEEVRRKVGELAGKAVESVA